jgi:adenylyl-sulfate kinase
VSNPSGTHVGRGAVAWFTGLSGAGKSTLAEAVAKKLRASGTRFELLDGDVVRTHLSKGLGFSREDRDINVARIAFVAHLLARNGVTVLVAAISPFRQTRDDARALIGDFLEVHVAPPLGECIKRDVKGLYMRAIAGEIAHFTGISDPYEPPLAAELTLDTSSISIEDGAQLVLHALHERGYLKTTLDIVTASHETR